MRTIASLLLAALGVASLLDTLNAQPRELPHVYLVKAAGCQVRPSERSQTGFRVSDPARKGLVTALHGVAGCSSLSARNDRGDVFNDLFVFMVDVEADVALLSS